MAAVVTDSIASVAGSSAACRQGEEAACEQGKEAHEGKVKKQPCLCLCHCRLFVSHWVLVLEIDNLYSSRDRQCAQ